MSSVRTQMKEGARPVWLIREKGGQGGNEVQEEAQTGLQRTCGIFRSLDFTGCTMENC